VTGTGRYLLPVTPRCKRWSGVLWPEGRAWVLSLLLMAG
jgi:hypothetical protein